MTVSGKPLVPRDWKTSRAIEQANERPIAFKKPLGQSEPALQPIWATKNRRHKKRPITLAECA